MSVFESVTMGAESEEPLAKCPCMNIELTFSKTPCRFN